MKTMLVLLALLVLVPIADARNYTPREVTVLIEALDGMFSTAGTFTGTLAVLGETTLGNAASDTVSIVGIPIVTPAAYFNGAVTLGNAAGDVITVTGTPTITPLLTLTTGLANNGETVLGNAATDTVTVTGYLSVLDKILCAGEVTLNGEVFLGNAATDTITATGVLNVASKVLGTIDATGGATVTDFIVAAGDSITVVDGIITVIKHP